MIVALIVLVVLTVGAVGLIRTVSASASIAGNLAFEQAATLSADQAIETAVVWLENNTGQTSSTTASTCTYTSGSTTTTLPVLACDQTSYGYAASRSDPSSSQSWGTFWTALVAAGYTAVTLSADGAGNTAAYLIQRMCTSKNLPVASSVCSSSALSVDTTSSMKAGTTKLTSSSQIYYRIIVKVSGPRNTVSYVQAMVAL